MSCKFLKNEYVITGQLDHTNIIKYKRYDDNVYFQNCNFCFAEMEQADKDLFDYISENYKLRQLSM